MKTIRITGGEFKSRAIEIAEGKEARYTPSKVREALFNILGDMEGRRILDLFAGSGSFTVEALSRGASSGTCVERDREMGAIIRRNLQSLSLLTLCEVMIMEVRRAVPFLYKKGYKYDIIFMDPPYDKGHVEETVTLLKDNMIIDVNGLVVIEHSKREAFDASGFGGWQRTLTKRYGDTCVTIYELHHDLT